MTVCIVAIDHFSLLYEVLWGLWRDLGPGCTVERLCGFVLLLRAELIGRSVYVCDTVLYLTLFGGCRLCGTDFHGAFGLVQIYQGTEGFGQADVLQQQRRNVCKAIASWSVTF